MPLGQRAPKTAPLHVGPVGQPHRSHTRRGCVDDERSCGYDVPPYTPTCRGGLQAARPSPFPRHAACRLVSGRRKRRPYTSAPSASLIVATPDEDASTTRGHVATMFPRTLRRVGAAFRPPARPRFPVTPHAAWSAGAENGAPTRRPRRPASS